MSQISWVEYNGIMKKILVVGYKGRMGSLITKELQKNFLVLGVEKQDCLWDYEDASLVVDFGSHESSLESARFCLKNNIPLIIGSTGQTSEELRELEEISKKIKIIRKANFSCGIEKLKEISKSILSLNPKNIEIIEKHHALKKDKPSGTAIEIANYLSGYFVKPIKITSIREDEEMGEHEIIFDLGDEKLSLKHNVYSREAFVRGVIEHVKSLTKF